MAEPWPDFEGECPDGIKPLHWIAMVALNGGATLAEVSAQIDRSTGTIGSWKRGWRARFGAGFLKSERKVPANISREAAERGAEIRGMMIRQGWKRERGRMSVLHGVTASLTLEVVMLRVNEYLENPEQLMQLDPQDLKALIWVAEACQTRADALEGIPDATKVALAAGRVPVQNGAEADARPPAGLLDDLEAGADDDVRELQRTAEETSERYLRLVGEGEPIDVEAREVI